MKKSGLNAGFFQGNCRVRRLGIDSHKQAAFMPRDCHVCRSEGFSALSRIELGKGERRVMATLMVVNGQGLAGGELVFTLMVVC
ncbi:hypothetical protein [Pseudomonas sp. BGI-2]|uniref:hypothetical protein n=1 Tax=Pseudomonas sp. BGI-2 TaxID=2528211 RepID=UPI002114F5E5|nr:hypothetical protein [Pseudomonas sp. BGI-2]